MTSIIPPRKENPGDPPKKFLVQVKTSEFLLLQQEAANRGIDLLKLGGSVLGAWLAAGCPDFGR